MMMDVAIVSHQTDYYLFNLLTTLQPLCEQGEIRDVYIWDNASTDRTSELLARVAEQLPRVHVLRSTVNVHHGPALDQLLRGACRSEWVLALDADTEVRRSFGAAVAEANVAHAAFVGQIHPQMPHLYAYLAHLLIHRPQYLDLPPFRHHGAPGIDYFRAIERERRPFARFRWLDYIHHFGQGSLRRVVERGDRTNEFYQFAHRQVEERPTCDARRAREREMEKRLRDFLDGAQPHTSAARARTAKSVMMGCAPQNRESTVVRREEPRLRRLSWLVAPRRTAVLAAARRMGLTQVDSEAWQLATIVERLRPRRVVEIGTAHGGSFLLWARAAASDATLMSIDLPPWELDDPAEGTKRRALARVGSRRQSVHVIRGDSHDPAVQRRSQECLRDEPIDFLFIDGDHSYEGVKSDFVVYGSRVRKGGIVALHDIQPHSRGWGGDVPVFWREIRSRYRHLELIADGRQDGFGIGVIWV